MFADNFFLKSHMLFNTNITGIQDGSVGPVQLFGLDGFASGVIRYYVIGGHVWMRLRIFRRDR